MRLLLNVKINLTVFQKNDDIFDNETKGFQKARINYKKFTDEEVAGIQKVMELTYKSRTISWRYVQFLVECGVPIM